MLLFKNSNIGGSIPFYEYNLLTLKIHYKNERKTN